MVSTSRSGRIWSVQIPNFGKGNFITIPKGLSREFNNHFTSIPNRFSIESVGLVPEGGITDWIKTWSFCDPTGGQQRLSANTQISRHPNILDKNKPITKLNWFKGKPKVNDSAPVPILPSEKPVKKHKTWWHCFPKLPSTISSRLWSPPNLYIKKCVKSLGQSRF